MLNPEELEEYFERARLSDAAINVIRRIRSSEPDRRVSSGANNVACYYASKKMGFTIQAESHTNELASLIGWEFDKHTYEIYDQPQKLKLSYIAKNGRRTTHLTTPDYFLLQERFAGWVECKPESKLQESLNSGSQLFIKDEKGNWRCPAGEASAAEYGLSFVVRSSAENNPTLVRNLGFLGDYFDERCPAVSEIDASEILKVFENDAWHDLRYLLDEGLVADHIYKMIVDQQLYFDIHNEILAQANRTIIYRNQEVADAYKVHVNSQKHPVTKLTCALKVDSGDSFIWDGVVWTILNAGDSFVSIENDDGVIQNLNIGRLEQLVKEAIVIGVPKLDSPQINESEEILRHASPMAYEVALNRYQQLFPEYPAQVIAPARSRRRWMKMYREAQLMHGSGFIGLLPNINNRGNRKRKIDQRVLEIIDDVIEEHYLATNGRSTTFCWGEVELRCSEEGLVAPSQKSILSRIREISSNKVKKIRDGEKAAYSKSRFIWYLERSTPRHGDRPFEIGHIDHTELDLQLVDSEYGGNLGKVWLTVLLDAFTRMVLAWVISYDSPSYRSCMAVIRHCVCRYGRVPKYFVLDQGSDFKSTYLDCLLARLESHKKMRPGGKPRFGSLIERFFGVNNQTFIHNLRGNNKPLQNARTLSRSHDPRALAVWTLPKLRGAFADYIENVYSKMEHPAFGVSPEAVMAQSLRQSGTRAHTLIPYSSDFVMMCLPSTPKGTAKVDPSRGVKIGYIYYWTPEFHNTRYANRQMPVRYDPYNMAIAMVWLNDHWANCESEYKEVFHNLTEKQIKDATQELRARNKREPKRRSINAKILAEFFRSITKTEQSLIEEQRRMDSFVQCDIPLLKTDIHKQQTLILADPNDMWANINTKVMGEFEL